MFDTKLGIWISVITILVIGSNVHEVSGALEISEQASGIEYPDMEGTLSIAIPEDLTNNVTPTNGLVLGKIKSTNGAQLRLVSGKLDLLLASDGTLTLREKLDHDSPSICTDPSTSKYSCIAAIRDIIEGEELPVLTIIVIDVNDNDPKFKQVTCDGNIEEIKEYETICTFEAEDADRFVDKNALTYSLRISSDVFEVDATSGVLRTQPDKTADYEAMTLHRLDIEVRDSDKAKTPTTYIQVITIKDMPDMPPIFIGLEQTKNVMESSKKDDLIMSLNAQDGDTGILDPVTYTFEVTEGTSSNGEDYFRLNSTTGEIRVNTELDAAEISGHRNNGLIFNIEVTATEVNEKSDSTTKPISFVVVDKDNSKPHFTPENEPPWDVVKFSESDVGLIQSFTVVDEDVDSKLNQYSAELVPPTEGGDDKTWFTDYIEITPDKGSGETDFEVRLKNGMHLDYDSVEQWQNQVVFEMAKLSHEAINVLIKSTFDVTDTITGRITLELTNENDNSPKWVFDGTELPVEVEENSKKGYLLGTLQATDDDFGDPYGAKSLRYGWDPNSIQPEYLDIDSITGAITISEESAFDYDLRKTESYVVKVWDMEHQDGANDNSAILKITVKDINDEKPILRVTPLKVTINENLPNGTQIPVTITASDGDLETFKLIFDVIEAEVLVNGQRLQISETEWFEVIQISETSAILQLKDVPDREQTESVQLTITVQDKNTHPDYADKEFDEVIIIININDLNDNLPFFDPIAADLLVIETDCVEEQTEFQRRIVDIRAYDDDLSAMFCFKLTSTDVGDDPRMLDLVELNPPEGTCSPSGKVTLRRKEDECIDREEFATLKYRIIVYDDEEGMVPRNENYTDLVIPVQDINDNTPEWDLDSIDQKYCVIESSDGVVDEVCADDEILILPCDPPGADHKACVKATDKDDEGGFGYGKISYILPRGTGAEITEAFAIGKDSGCICAIKIDREDKASYYFTIAAWDYYREEVTSGSRFTETNVAIRVVDVNDNSPVFETASGEIGSVPEEVAPNVALSNKILVTDADEGDHAKMAFQIKNVICTRPNGDPCVGQVTDAFQIEPKEAVGAENLTISTTANFDFKYAYGNYCIEIEASNVDGAPVVPTVEEYCVQVTDINNNAPSYKKGEEFEGTNFYVYEATLIGDTLTNYTHADIALIFEAEDLDEPETPNSQIVYKITENGEADTTYFQINTNGAVSLKKRWHPEDNVQSMPVCVVAEDAGEPPLSSDEVCFEMRLKAVNTYAPIFPEFEKALQVTENERPQKIGEIFKATDQDNDGLSPDEPIYYYIAGYNNASSYFELPDREKTDINSRLELDYEDQTQHQILIVASNDQEFVPPPDMDPGQNKSFLLVTVDVINVFDVAPTFPKGVIIAGVSTLDEVNDPIPNFLLQASDPEVDSSNDSIQYEISSAISVSDESLIPVQNPFVLISVNSEGKMILNFQPQSAMKGHFSFNITAFDRGYNSGSISCKVYMITIDSQITFKFLNEPQEVREKRLKAEEIFSTIFEYDCHIANIDIVKNDETGETIPGQAEVTAYFVDSDKSEPILSTEIMNMLITHPSLNQRLHDAMSAEGLSLS